MKTFNELTKKELAKLDETQVDAYVDIELAEKGIVKPIITNTEFPDFLKVKGVYPETDLEIYEVDGYSFLELETAKKFAEFVGKLAQVSVDYNWDIGSEFKKAKDTFFKTPQVQVTKVYSEPKYETIKEQLKQIKIANSNKEKENDKVVDDVVNYEAIDSVKYEIKNKVRNAIDFFNKSKVISSNYTKYFGISNDKDIALNTLYSVYNIQDDELKNQILEDIENLPKEEVE